MNRPVYFLEDRSPDRSAVLSTWVKGLLQKINEPEERINPQAWAVYCNDRRIDRWDKSIRPRSKLVLAAQFAPPVDLSTAYEDSKIVVLDKPADLPTQKTLKNFEDNLYDQARLFYLQSKAFPAGLPYVGLHHRLDRGTSGLVLMTKQRQANKEVSDLFKNRKIYKEYVAFVEWGDGSLPAKWRQTDPIKRGPAQKKRFYFKVDPSGESAISEFHVIDSVPEKYFMLACFPKTGRTHQLRVHLAHKGHPVLGDSVYGRKATASRLMLHARQLEFVFGGKKLKIESPSPLKL